MEKTITYGDNGEKSIRLKSSAATNILYKKTFREDVLLKLAEYSKNTKELMDMRKKVEEIRADESKPKEEVLAEMQTMLNSEAFAKSQEFQNDTLPKLAYVMYLEANEKDIFSKLNEEQYLFWLLGLNQEDLLTIVSPVIDIWQSGAKQNSKPKN